MHNSYPSYTSSRPKIQIYHGYAGPIVAPAAAVEAVKQWSTVLNQPFSKIVSGVPSSAYTQMIYGDGTQLQACFRVRVGHTTPVQEQLILKF